MPSRGQPQDELPQPLALARVERRRWARRAAAPRARRAGRSRCSRAGGCRPTASPTWSPARSREARLLEHPLDGRLGVARRAPAARTARRFSATRELAVERRLLGHPADLARADATTLPASGRWIPARIDSSVVLPAPLGPMTATSSPRPGAQRDAAQRRALAVALRRSLERPRGVAQRSAVQRSPHRRARLAAMNRSRREAPLRRRRGRRHRPAHAAARCCPALRERAPARLRRRQRRERRRRRRHHPEDRATSCSTPAVDAITLGNHAYRHRDVYELPRPRASASCGRPTTPRAARAAATPSSRRRAAARRRQPVRATLFLEAGALAVRRGGRGAGRAARKRRRRARRHARRGDQREGRDGLAPRRARDRPCVGTHTHVPTADARVLPGGHRLHHRRRHDRPARRRDRRQARAGDRALPDADAGALRDLARRTRG